MGVSTDELVESYMHKTPIIPFEQRMAIVEEIRDAEHLLYLKKGNCFIVNYLFQKLIYSCNSLGQLIDYRNEFVKYILFDDYDLYLSQYSEKAAYKLRLFYNNCLYITFLLFFIL